MQVLSFCLLQGNQVSSVGDTRILWVGGDYGPSSTIQFHNNRIISSKYTIWNFLPKNLFEQFRRIANFYFLCMTVIALTIDSPVEPVTSVLPLVFVILVTALKQGYEDWLRHRSDNEVNCAPVTVIRKGIVQDIKAKDVHVGDLIRIVSDAEVPCDLVLLSSSDRDGRCYVTTANLDGETNLKTLLCPRLLHNLSKPEKLARLKAQIECENPTPDLYNFFGKIELFPEETDVLISSQRTSIQSVRSTHQAYIFGAEAPQDGVNGDISVHQQNSSQTNVRTSVLSGDIYTNHDRNSVTRSIHSQQINNTATVVSDNITLDLVDRAARTSSLSDKQHICDESGITRHNFSSVNADPTGILRGDSNLSDKSFNRNSINGAIPLMRFGEEIEESVRRTTIIGDVPFEQESMFRNSGAKRSIVSNHSSILGSRHSAGHVETVYEDKKSAPLGTENLLLRGARLKNTEFVIEISVYLEAQKFIGSLFFKSDLELYCEKSDQPAICNTSDLNEELGQVEYLFTDKTGTLTENTMWFRRCSIAGIPYIEQEGKLFQLLPDGDQRNSTLLETINPDIEQFFLALALCHSVQVGSGNGHTNNNTNHEPIAQLDYQASSPDEKALVEASARRLNTLEFTSGAESSVIPLAEGGHTNITLQHIADFALRGLRTLVVGIRKLSIPEYSQLAAQVERSRQTLSTRRASIIAATYNKLESSLTLLGATGVEDQLQEGVQETLESLRAAGIKVWILTGDKVETAVNISYSCGHLKAGARQLYLTGHNSPETCFQTLKTHRAQVSRDRMQHYGLIVDGQSLYYALNASENHQEAFSEVCKACTAVICCRMSPLQKCQFLRRVLLVHGHWYYLRVATIVQYFFYKNIVFITPQLYHGFSNSFSTEPLYHSLFLTCFNILFTSLPIFIYGLFEQNNSAQTLLDYPQLYINIRRIWHSLVLYYVPWFFVQVNTVFYTDNTPMEKMAFGTFIYHCVVFVVNFKLVLRSRYWTWLFLGSIFISVFGFMIFTVIYSIATTGELHNVYTNMLGSLLFWIWSILLIVICLVPDCTASVFHIYTRPLFRKLRKSWRSYISRKKRNHYSFNRSTVQRMSSAQASRISIGSKRPSCGS
ncbi:hypothetical protein C0J52_02130 [Blattella germanica]|nr:hypothetical protein C0J52_02130 [Blattella germanica]